MKTLLSLLLLLIVVCVGMLLAFTVFFKADTIKVEGGSVYDAQMIIQKSGVKKGDNLFRVSEKSVNAKLISSLPYVGSAVIERKLPSTLIIKITDTREAAAFALNGSYVLVDKNGRVLSADSSVLRQGVALVVGVTPEAKQTPGEALALKDTARQKALMTVLNSLSKCGLTNITEINLKNLSAVTMVYDERITLTVGPLTNVDVKLSRAKEALKHEDEIDSSEKGTLDLTIGSDAYFKPAPETTTKASTAKSTKKTTKASNAKSTKTTTKISV